MVEYPDILNNTRDELIEKFCKLFDRYQELRESNEADTQKIHELKRSLDTATAAQAYLSQELEQYTNSNTTQEENELQKTISDLVELKKKYGKLEESFRGLQQDYNTLLDENSMLTHSLEEAANLKESVPEVYEHRMSEDDLQRIQMLELENMELLEKIEEFQDHTVRYTLTIGEFEKNIEILRDQINCLEENLQSKKEDLEEKLQILESTQEQLAEANSKIAMLSTAPEADDRKGNSLFAEVDDQRQAMRKLLAAQKQNYLHMKKIYTESEHEIRRLKRENISMHTELEACSSIFCNADKVYQDKLNKRIRHLLNQNEELERKLNWTQNRIKELASEKGVLWLDSMLNLCKKETDDLKKQLHSVHMEKANLEEQLRNSQQDVVRWRFESLKSRCILLDREQLLTENSITFKPVQAIEFCITEKQQNEARPRIVGTRRSSTFENIQRRSTTPLKVLKDKNENAVQEQELVNKELHKECEQEQVTCEENLKSSVTKTTSEAINNKEMINDACEQINKLDLKICTDDQDNQKETSGGDENKITVKAFQIYTDAETEGKENVSTPDISIKSKFSKLVANAPSPMRPSQRSLKMTPRKDPSTPPARSILNKHSNLFSKEECKSVKFSSKEDVIIPHLSPNSQSPSECKNSASSSTLMCNENVGTTAAPPSTSTSSANNSKAIVMESRTKSNIVVRRIVIGSKHD